MELIEVVDWNFSAIKENSPENETYFSLEESDYPLSYRVVATILHSLILIFGVAGNIVLITVARRTKSLQTPTYCYLVSLAYADLLVLLSAVPEAIVFHHVGRRWLFGQVICSLFIYINFLGINAGSISILAFTVERYIAIVASPLAAKYCTTERTKRVITVLWIVTMVYCCPWLGLTEVKQDPTDPESQPQCDFRFSPQVYMGFFAVDFGLFYVIPLAVAVFVYSRIAVVLCRSAKLFNASPYGSVYAPSPRALSPTSQTNGPLLTPKNEDWDPATLTPTARSASKIGVSPRLAIMNQSRVQVLPMLVVTVLFFALAWLPFRGLLIYNSLIDEPWLDIWYLLLAKTLIYLNSAINPFLYNAMSRRFRVAVRRMLSSRFRRKHKLAYTPAFRSTPVTSTADAQKQRGHSPAYPSVPACSASCQLRVPEELYMLSHSRTAQF